ncbi:efflux RND transporter periplasmic adaptor subunit [Zongyangia hominis]|uniref:Efflux RND transporter periplasmic adaptor subunit n=1 Tax=Zongyangia hominis TaxID=2763677 RepID=A0A926E950_9FIRM|nr:efflux RND transporter periplasmic adaptor subunit [Zongyangia hominis]MBC8569488.1 efflux RND transporter periplasmic adaptor subunit [Zongyangia hominis]
MEQDKKKPRNTKRMLWIAAAAVVLVIGGAIVLRLVGQKPAEVVDNTQVLVETQKVSTGDISLSTDFIGKVAPDESVNIFPKATGEVLATYFEVGDTVKKGDLLFEINPEDALLQFNISKASYDVAVANVNRTLGSGLDATILQSQSGYDQAKLAYNNALSGLDDLNDQAGSQLSKLADAKKQTATAVAQTKSELQKLESTLNTALEAYIAMGYDPDEPPTLPDTSAPDESGSDSEPSSDYEAACKLWEQICAVREGIDATQTAYQKALEAQKAAEEAYQQASDGFDVNVKKLEQALDAASLSLDTASKSYDITMEKAVPETKESAAAALEQAKASYEAAEKQLGYTKVYAPIDGVIEQKNVKPLGMVSTQAPSYVISNKEIMVVTFNASAAAVQGMDAGDAVTVEAGGKTYQGVIVEVASMVDAQSGLFPVKARIEGDGASLLTGLSVKLTAATSKAKNALMVPLSAVYYENNEPYVYLLSNGIAVKTFITTGISNEENIQVLAGVPKDAQLISTWHPNLKDGVQVTVKSAEGEQ